jgi:uncharacterized membrane protein
MYLWLIPMVYVGASVAIGLALPRIEHTYLTSHTLNLSITSAQAYLSAAASGMMALTGIVFAMAFVMVQFSAIAYSPRLVLWFARDRMLFHSLGVFAATFIYALFALAWVGRGGSGTVPLISPLLVGVLLIASMLLFSRLVQRISDLQITNVLCSIGDKGREVIHEVFHRIDSKSMAETKPPNQAVENGRLGPITQILRYSGAPRTIARLNVEALVRQGAKANCTIVMKCAVGDTVVEGTPLLQVHGAKIQLEEAAIMRAVRLERERTFQQDPKYPIRLLVDVAIKALSPAVNDPTTAVQAIDQIEDLLHRLGECALDSGWSTDTSGIVRFIVPMPTWEDYLTLAFDEIRLYGATSIQVVRRLRSALTGLIESIPNRARADAVRRYVEHLDQTIENSTFDAEDRLKAREEDRQGLGLSRGGQV